MVQDLYGQVDINQENVVNNSPNNTDPAGRAALKKPRITFDPSSTTGTVKMEVKDGNGKESIILNGTKNAIYIKNKKGQNSLLVNDKAGELDFFDGEGQRSLAIRGRYFDGKTVGMWLGATTGDPGPKGGVFVIRNSSGIDYIVLEGNRGSVHIRNSSGRDTIVLEGNRGDIILNNADCAEDFDILDSQHAEPGTVMVLENEGKLRQSTSAYDKKVAGVISGAGDCKPGIVLDKKPSMDNRKPVALMGKVYCKVDAELASIEVGDLLTTSSTHGHAMKVKDTSKALGAIIGKALRPLREGKGLIPILIALQ